ncbi:MAG: pyruvate kinase [Clostridia bacterium]|nr:pyruvate kinase [Clostridia bacterium]
MKRTKIICTIGPASSKVETIEKMIAEGMDVARFNMSHGSFESHHQLIENVKAARKNLGRPVSIMIDTKGPEIRIGQFKEGHVLIVAGKTFDLLTSKCEGDDTKVGVSYSKLPDVVEKGTKILIDDGKIELKVVSTEPKVVHTKVVVGGKLSNNKSINIPGVELNMPYVNKYDIETIEFACKEKADYVAISFVNTKQDVLQIRKLLDKFGGGKIKIISKIESQKGTDNMLEILSVSDGIMVARGDLGVEVDFAKIPVIQKEILEACTQQGKLSIVATQMLESMTTDSRPTRAEISDIANAVLDGTCAIMLSGETTVGAHPVLAVSTMAKIVAESEQANEPNNISYCNPDGLTQNDAMAYGAYSLAYASKADAIVCLYDITADNVSDFNPNRHIFFFTTSESEYHQSAMLRGVVPILTKTRLAEASCVEQLKASKFLKHNSLVVVLCGDTIKLARV